MGDNAGGMLAMAGRLPATAGALPGGANQTQPSPQASFMSARVAHQRQPRRAPLSSLARPTSPNMARSSSHGEPS